MPPGQESRAALQMPKAPLSSTLGRVSELINPLEVRTSQEIPLWECCRGQLESGGN